MSAPAPSFDPNESQAWVAITVVTVTLTVATTCVCLRTYARAVIIQQFGWDDWAAILAMILALGSGILVASNTIYGHGRHIAVVDQTQLWKYFRTFYISIVLYNGSLTATKLTFLLQYHRIFGRGYMRKLIIAAFVFVALWSISQLLVVIFTCTPIHKFWLPETPGTCIPNLPFWYVNAAGNIVTDVIVFVLPLSPVARLNLRRGQKVGLIGIFSLGFFTCAISVIRIQYLKLSDDVTWDNVASSCWSVGELCSGITCACLPTLRPLLSKVLPGLLSWQDSKYSGGGGGGSDGTNVNNNKKRRYYLRSSSGRDHDLSTIGSSGRGHMHKKSADGNASSRGIMYPEDVELSLQSDDRSDKEIRVVIDRRVPTTSGTARPMYGGGMDGLGLGVKPSVKTEIKVGSQEARDSWPVGERGIEVKRDFVMTTRGL